jgi:hypothetical protein
MTFQADGKPAIRCPHYRIGLCVKDRCARDRVCQKNGDALVRHIGDLAREIVETIGG